MWPEQWPDHQAYLRAARNPRNFLDPRLAAATTERMGNADRLAGWMPTHGLGGFGIVVKLVAAGQAYAAKMLTSKNEAEAWRIRYEGLQHYLARTPLAVAPMVDVEYLEPRRGIRVEGQQYPVVLMPWVEGRGLRGVLESCRHDRLALGAVIGRWLDLAAGLRALGVAHGDIHPLNVRVQPDDTMVLIDYDSVWHRGTTLTRRPSAGHDQFRHPKARETDFGPRMDSFSFWSIYTSCVALRSDPGLWELCERTEDGLILTLADLESPSRNGSALSCIARSKDRQVRRLAKLVVRFLDLGPLEVPPLRAGDAAGTADCPTCGRALGGRADLGPVSSACMCWERPPAGEAARPAPTGARGTGPADADGRWTAGSAASAVSAGRAAANAARQYALNVAGEVRLAFSREVTGRPPSARPAVAGPGLLARWVLPYRYTLCGIAALLAVATFAAFPRTMLLAGSPILLLAWLARTAPGRGRWTLRPTAAGSAGVVRVWYGRWKVRFVTSCRAVLRTSQWLARGTPGVAAHAILWIRRRAAVELEGAGRTWTGRWRRACLSACRAGADASQRFARASRYYVGVAPARAVDAVRRARWYATSAAELSVMVAASTVKCLMAVRSYLHRATSERCREAEERLARLERRLEDRRRRIHSLYVLEAERAEGHLKSFQGVSPGGLNWGNHGLQRKKTIIRIGMHQSAEDQYWANNAFVVRLAYLERYKGPAVRSSQKALDRARLRVDRSDRRLLWWAGLLRSIESLAEQVAAWRRGLQ